MNKTFSCFLCSSFNICISGCYKTGAPNQ